MKYKPLLIHFGLALVPPIIISLISSLFLYDFFSTLLFTICSLLMEPFGVIDTLAFDFGIPLMVIIRLLLIFPFAFIHKKDKIIAIVLHSIFIVISILFGFLIMNALAGV